jgi:ribonuclease T2
MLMPAGWIGRNVFRTAVNPSLEAAGKTSCFARSGNHIRPTQPAFKLVVMAALLCMAGGVEARHRGGSGGVPGQFDYYLLSLSWSPAFCLESPGAAECHGPRRYGFIVHGLWPQDERGHPEHCDLHREVPEEVVRDMADIMPARGLVYHEWSAHGSCSGLEPADYFALVRQAYHGVSIPPQLSAPRAPIEQSTSAIGDAFMQSNPRLPPGSVVVICSRQDAPRLREVRLCLGRDLEPRACSADVMREACRAPGLIVPPVR